MKIISEKNKVVIEKLNFMKKHQRPDAKGKEVSLKKKDLCKCLT